MDFALTLDYELWGDGSGHIFKDVIEPTDKILDICDLYNAKITIFFEVVEYWRIKKEWESGNYMGYTSDPAAAMKMQIADAYRRGHDVQLHIHPQFINAKFEDGAWRTDDKWCMKDIPLNKNSSFDMNLKKVLSEGKRTLEDILKPVSSSYVCNIFRAGGFNILPSENIIKTLEELKFKADSSVFAGGYEISNLSNIDYRKIKNTIPYWSIKNNNVLIQENNLLKESKMIELPVYAFPIRRYKKYDLTRLKNVFRDKKSAFKTVHSKLDKKTILQKINFFLQEEYITCDYCLFNVTKMKKFLNLAQKTQKKIGYYPFCLIGHSKGYHSDKALIFLLKSDKNINFITLTKVLEKIKRYQIEK